MASNNRPLSPHLQVYKPQLTSMMSIAHRATGAFLCAGAVWITFGLLALSNGEASWLWFLSCNACLLGKLVIFGFALALAYHWLNGLRHLGWDAGYGLDIQQTYRSGHALLAVFGLAAVALAYVIFGGAI
jgi:succinate dehydrogenase / fumarate reductase, cytochrome b subunit